MIERLFAGVPRRTLGLLALLLAVLAIAPLMHSDYVLTVLILFLYFAYVGQAWNIMMGFAGLLSLGHSLYVGLGAYAAAALYVHYGVGPWIGLLPAVAASMLCGAAMGFLAFRFRVSGVYFAILTIAFAEFARIGFDHFRWVGGSAGLFLPVAQYTHNDLWRLRGDPTMFYYVLLAATVLVFAACHLLLRSRVGYFWRAIREDEEAARAAGINAFRYKMYAVIVSAGLTSFAGVFYAFFYNNLFPEQIFHISRSIEFILGPIIGGVGTLFGPIIGAFVLQVLAEGMRALLTVLGIDVPGVKQLVFGVFLLVVVLLMPDGIWPWLARKLGIREHKPENKP
jgi:branched-chain amino acid transport system permease protein